MNIAILVLALLGSPAPSASAGPATFQGIVLGETATAMVATQGEPVLVSSNSGGSDYIYLASSDNALTFAHVVRGNVVAVAIKPAGWKPRLPAAMPGALGVLLGDPAVATVRKIPKAQFLRADTAAGGAIDGVYRGTDGLLYVFTSNQTGKIVWIRAELPKSVADALPDAPIPVLHGGTSMADAIVDVAPDEDVGVGAEYVYLAAHPCGNGGSWKSQKQSLLQNGGRSYDLMSETCSDGSESRDFYFDITAYFGKMEP